MEILKFINIGLRFLLELCILAIFGYWGFKTGSNLFMKFLLSLGAPILFAVLWGVFLAPESSMRRMLPRSSESGEGDTTSGFLSWSPR